MRRIDSLPTPLRLSFVLIAALGLPEPPVRAQPMKSGGELLVAARRGWEDYERVARKWSVRIRSDVSNFDQGRQVYSSVDEVLARGNGRSFSVERTDGFEPSRAPETKTRLCKVSGPEYEFTARQSPGHPGWALTSVVDHAAIRRAIARKDLPADRRSIRDEVESEYLLLAVAVDNQLVSRLVGHACCRTEHFAPASPAAGAPVEWRFTVDQARRPTEMRQVESGRVLFDPSQRWVIREYWINNRNGRGGISTIHRSLTYQPGPGGYPVPVEVRTELVTDDKSCTSTGLDRVELVPQTAPPADSEFALSAYGIPEGARGQTYLGLEGSGTPSGGQTRDEPSTTGWYFPLAIAGVGLIAVALAIRYLRNRRRQDAVHAPI